MLMFCVGAFLGKLMAEAATEGQAAYAKAGGVAEEVRATTTVFMA
jgi:hypothetical protein